VKAKPAATRHACAAPMKKTCFAASPRVPLGTGFWISTIDAVPHIGEFCLISRQISRRVD
jgi:hypothetical protein